MLPRASRVASELPSAPRGLAPNGTPVSYRMPPRDEPNPHEIPWVTVDEQSQVMRAQRNELVLRHALAAVAS